MRSVDGRIRDLLGEVDAIHAINDGAAHGKREFLSWKSRAEAAVVEKLGEGSPLFKQLQNLHYEYYGAWVDGMEVNDQPYFRRDLDAAAAILEATLEAEPVVRQSVSSSPIVSINQVGPVATASSHATAEVTLDGSAESLRRLVIESEGLSREERGKAIASIPDDDEEITLDQVDTLLGVALKSKSLLGGIAGWLLANLDRLPIF